jgi:hypothetical protein
MAVGRVVSSCLEKRPEERPSSMQALDWDLSDLSPQGSEASSARSGALEPSVSLRNRKRRIVIL